MTMERPSSVMRVASVASRRRRVGMPLMLNSLLSFACHENRRKIAQRCRLFYIARSDTLRRYKQRYTIILSLVQAV